MDIDESDNIILHIGLHKTATTFLQREVFPKIKGINYIDMCPSKNNKSILSVDIIPGKINLITRESLSGSPYNFKKNISAKQRDLIIKRLKRIFPNAKIIIGVREKQSWLNSLYKQHIRMSPDCSKEEFLQKFDSNYLNHEEYISLIKSLFKEVYVYQYEDLKSNPEEFVDGICKFIEVETPEWENKVHLKSVNSKQEKLMLIIYKITRYFYLIIREKILGE